MTGYLHMFAEMAQQAYGDTHAISNDPLFVNVIDSGNVGRVLAFQGTHDIKQILADLDVETVSTKSFGKVHKGFYETIADNWGEISSAIGGQKCWFVGHSLGGALAVMAAASALPEIVTGVVTFGCPKICVGSELYDYFKSHGINVFQYRHGEDIVPTVPSWMKHAGDQYEVGKPEHWYVNVEDHAVAQYIAACEGV